MTRAIVCPVALHPDGAPLRIPVFEHPRDSLQIVKGDLKDDESFAKAAARALFEQSGLETRSALYLSGCDTIQKNTVWHFSLCRLAPIARENWQHFHNSDGGHWLKFTWLSLDDKALLQKPYANALAWIKDTL